MIFDATTGHFNPQEGARVNIIGKLKETNSEGLKAQFLLRHLATRAYAGFSGFNLYKMNVENSHFVVGFARIIGIEKRQTILSKQDLAQIAKYEPKIIDHLNTDHIETVVLLASNIIEKHGKILIMITANPEGSNLKCGRKSIGLVLIILIQLLTNTEKNLLI